MFPSKLLEQNFELKIITPPYKLRKKVYGWMYEGNGVLQKGNITFNIFLYSHIQEEEPKCIPIDEFAIKNVRINDEFYDAYWHLYMSENEIWINKEGWFKTGKRPPFMTANYNFSRDKQVSQDVLKEYNFEPLIITQSLCIKIGK